MITEHIEFGDTYPGWEPDTDNEWFRLVKKEYEKVLGREPKILSIHAGLETGAIKGRISDMKLVAIGPTIHNAHSPREEVEIQSVQVIYELLKNIISHADELN